MKALRINPCKYDIELMATKFTAETKDLNGTGDVMFTLGETSGIVTLLAAEAESLSRWFSNLAKEIRRKRGAK